MKKLFYFLISVLCFTACGDDPLADSVYQFKVTAKYDSKYMNVMDFYVDYSSGHVDPAHDSIVKHALIYGGYQPTSPDSSEFSASWITDYIPTKGDTMYYYSDHIENDIDVILLFDEFKGYGQSLKGLTYKAPCYGGASYDPYKNEYHWTDYSITVDCSRICPEYDDEIQQVLEADGWTLDRVGQRSYSILNSHAWQSGTKVYQVADFYIEVIFCNVY